MSVQVYEGGQSRPQQPHRIRIHIPGYSLGLKRSELTDVPPAAQAPESFVNNAARTLQSYSFYFCNFTNTTPPTMPCTKPVIVHDKIINREILKLE